MSVVGVEWTDGGEAVGPLLPLSLMSTTVAVGAAWGRRKTAGEKPRTLVWFIHEASERGFYGCRLVCGEVRDVGLEEIPQGRQTRCAGGITATKVLERE
jgi:hypothetical protein